MRLPAYVTSPVVGLYTPLITFISVVLPEPFGPMSPTTLPRSTSKLTSDSAHKPPKRIPTSEIRSTTSCAADAGTGCALTPYSLASS